MFDLLANINLNRLDSAFDIDPLFHKMSKTFDEGGAKGLLLANLGVGQNGCNIVFDSSHDDNGVEETSSKTSNFTSPRLTEGMMDVTSLTAKLESLLQEQEEQNIGAQSLVPQLSTLRAEHDALEAGGFVENGAVALAATVGPKTPGKRLYHANANEEREADYSIHKEAMERSRLSAGQNLSTRFLDSPSDYTKQDDDDDLVDFGGGYDDGDDDDGVDAFIATSGYRYSDVSFPLSETKNAVTSTKPDIATTYTANLIDAIASGQTVLSCNDYEYFNKACETNYWAGSAHWKRAARTRKDAVQSTKKANTKTPKKPIKTKERVMVLLMRAPNLSQLFATKGRSKHRSTQLSKAMIEKHTNQENLLPEDAGFEVEQLTKLFLRPNAVLKTQNTRIREESGEAIKSPNGVGKSVGFDVPDWDDGSYGDINDDGGGFDFGADDHGDEDDEFLVQELEGVRKVEKIRVGCAAVAKKVDVKRLKRDLWAELESKFAHSNNDDDMKYGKGSEETASTEQDVVSFHDAVRELDLQKSQVDATLPFYFICILHLANEKGLRLEQEGLEDFTIHPPDSDIALVPF